MKSNDSWAEKNWQAIIRLPYIESPMRICAVKGCRREVRTKGLCLAHYRMARREFDPEWAARQRARENATRRKRKAAGNPPPLRIKRPWSVEVPYKRPKKREQVSSTRWTDGAMKAAIEGVREAFDPTNPAWDAPDPGAAGTVPSAGEDS
jgi:hypothetical protein